MIILFYSYIGSIGLSSLIDYRVFSNCNKKLKADGLLDLKKNISLGQKFLKKLKIIPLIIFPILNIVLSMALLIDFDEYYEGVKSNLLEEEYSNIKNEYITNENELVLKNEKDKFDYMTIEEQIEFLDNESEKLHINKEHPRKLEKINKIIKGD